MAAFNEALALTERLAPAVACVHVIEADRSLAPTLEPLAAEAAGFALVGDSVARDDAEQERAIARCPERFPAVCRRARQ